MDVVKKVKAGEAVPKRIVTEETDVHPEQAKEALPSDSTDRYRTRRAGGPGPRRSGEDEDDDDRIAAGPAPRSGPQPVVQMQGIGAGSRA